MIYKQINIGELEGLINTNEFKCLDKLAVSSIRAISQINNPRANKEDVALIMAYNDSNELIGFIGLLPDIINNTKVFWNTCWWTDPEKGKSAAFPLLLQAIKASNNKFLATDLTQHSKKILSKLSLFEFSPEIRGLKGFMNYRFGEILPKKKALFKFIKPILILTDTSLNLFVTIKHNRCKGRLKQISLKFEYVNSIDDESAEFIHNNSTKDLFRRKGNELNWILKYPWIKPLSEDSQNEKSRYYFSSFEDGFEYKMVKFYNDDKDLIAFLFFRIRNRHVHIPYAFFENKHTEKVVVMIYRVLFDTNAVTFETYNHRLVNAIENFQSPFIYQKTVYKDFVYSKEIKDILPADYTLQDGDGDVVFT